MSLLHDLRLMRRAIPPLPLRRKLAFFKALVRSLKEEQDFELVEARNREEALQRLGLPADWNDSNKALDRHTRRLLAQTWEQDNGPGKNVFEIIWARRVVVDPDFDPSIMSNASRETAE